MKKTIFFLAITTFIVGTVLVSCKSTTKEEVESQEKVDVAEQNLKDAKDSLVVAKKAATAEEWQTFKNQTDSVISYNEAQIAELKLKMQNAGKSVDAKYQKNVDILEQKNKDLKVKADTYKNDANSDWQSFKREFKHDMDEIGQAFKDVTVNNKK
jgi:Na+-transporting methylmalonyl-CoA/oxaloacetate decarboxylase gamma subunit